LSFFNNANFRPFKKNEGIKIIEIKIIPKKKKIENKKLLIILIKS